MKAWVHYTSKLHDETERVEEITTLAELLELMNKEGSDLIISKTDWEPFKRSAHPKYLKELKENGRLDCELDLEVYNDYRE